MSGWVPMPADGWPEIAEALSATGAPWPRPAAVVDLRWWVDQRGLTFADRTEPPTAAELVAGVPGRPTLRQRWGWTDHAVRSLLKDNPSWWDHRRWGLQPSPADRQRTASPSPADRQLQDGPTETTERESPADRQPVASVPPADLHTRDPITPSPSPSPSPPEEPTGGTAMEDAPTVEDTTSCTMVVRGRVAPDPDAPTELQVAELVALQQTAMPSRADHDAVTRLLVKPGVTAEVARAMWEAAAADDWWQEATDTGEPRLRWRSLAKPGPGLDKRIGAAQEAVAELARRAWRNRTPDPPPPKKTFDIFAKKRFETVEQHEQRVRNLRAMMAKKTADGAQK